MYFKKIGNLRRTKQTGFLVAQLKNLHRDEDDVINNGLMVVDKNTITRSDKIQARITSFN